MFRNSTQMGRWIAIAVAIGLLCSWEAQAKKPPKPGAKYDLVVMAPPGIEISRSIALDLDEFGNVVGYYSDSVSELNGFYYSRAENRYVLYGPDVLVSGLNNLGEMVGNDDNTGEGVYWSAPDAAPKSLSPLEGHQNSRASKINDAGIIVGQSCGNGSSAAVACRVNAERVVSAPIELPFPEGDIRGSVSDLSEEDADGISRVVGYSGAVDLYETAVMWEVAVVDGLLFLLSGPTDLGSIDGVAAAAYGINSPGDIVGLSHTAEANAWPFVKPAGQLMQALPGIQKAWYGHAYSVNANGNMVGSMGYLFKGLNVQKAVLWPDAGSVIDLNKKVRLGVGEELRSALVINNAGVILASGRSPRVSQGDVAYLLIPK